MEVLKMLYKKNGAESLSEKLFENPTSEYRAAPFGHGMQSLKRISWSARSGI